MDYEKVVNGVRLCGSSPSTIQCLGQCAFYTEGDINKCIPKMTQAAAVAIESLQKALEMARAERDVVHKALIERMIKERHSQWIKDGDFLVCPECDSEIDIENSSGAENAKNYCPNCGAIMDKEAENK